MVGNAMMKIKSIKFYCMAPLVTQGKLNGSELKSTFHSHGDDLELHYEIDTGPSGTLTVIVGSTAYVYKLADIVGRIEASL